MNRIHKIINVALYQLIQLIRNPRLYMIVFCNTIFISSWIFSMRHFMQDYQMKVTPFLFCFLFTHASVIFCFLAGIVILFSNAPCFTNTQFFLLIRTGRKIWAAGQIIYIVLGSVLYFTLLYLLSIIFLVPYLSFENEWGSVWNTLGRSNAGLVYGVDIIVPREIMNLCSPLQALGWIFLVGVLNAIFLGLLLFFCNVLFCREAGIVLSMLLLLTPYRIGLLPTFMHYIAMPAWLNPSYLIQSMTYQGPGMTGQLMILIGANIIVVVGCIWVSNRRDLPEVEE